MKQHIVSKVKKPTNPEIPLDDKTNFSSPYKSFLSNIGHRYALFSHHEGILNFVSGGIMQVSQKEPTEFLGQHIKDMFQWTEESLSLLIEVIGEIVNKEIEYVECEMDFYSSDHTLKTLYIIQYPRYDIDENIICIDAIAEDITDKKKIENDNRYLKSLIDEFAVYVKTDSSGIIVDASDSFYREFKGNKESLKGKKINILQSGRTSEEHYAKLWKAIQAGNIFEHEIQNCNLQMEKHWYHVKIIPKLDYKSDITGYMAFYHNIDDKILLKKEAHTDPLTGLNNRQYLQDIHSQINLNDYDIMMIDLDHFKRINDTYGHHFGDIVLKNISQVLRDNSCDDDILIRYGGEEFLILLYNPTKDIQVTKMISERIRFAIENTHTTCKGLLIKPTVSIGIEAHTERTRNLEEAILHADEMLYLAKNKGRNRIEIYDEVKSELNRNSKNKYTITEIKEALDEDRLICHYQPIVNAQREIIKFESLVRLIHRDGSLMMPDTFIPLIKNTNIYVDMTKQVINYNFNFFKDKSVNFTFNLSFSDLLNKSIINIIANKLEECPDRAKYLTIELLEDEMIDDFEEIQNVMHTFRQNGVKFAIDDFGSGYANFGNIFKLNFDYLKINGELISNICTSEHSRNMVESLSSFAKKVQIKTIAEYIENEKIFEYVKKYDIDLYQGYHIGKPLPKLVTIP